MIKLSKSFSQLCREIYQEKLTLNKDRLYSVNKKGFKSKILCVKPSFANSEKVHLKM